MNKSEIRKELIERYNATGRIGFTKPKNVDEAMSIIETLVNVHEEEQPKEELVVNLSDMTKKLKEFFDNF